MRSLCLLCLLACFFFCGVSGFAAARTISFCRAPLFAGKNSVIEGDQKESLTNLQIKTVRKELSRRRASKSLKIFYLENDECTQSFPLPTLQTIAHHLQEHELVQVRGIAFNQKPRIKATTERLKLELGTQQAIVGRLVSCVEIKGYAATFYCPVADRSMQSIQLRSTGKANHWDKRVKAPRDNRGQIIR